MIDAKTFEIHLNRPFAFVIEALGKPGNVIPVMMPARLASLDIAKPVPEVIGSGPFTFRRNEWRPGERAIFDRNPAYKPRPEPPDGLSGGKVVKIERVDLVSMPDQATRVAALQTGEMDLLEIVPFDFIDELKHDHNVTVTSQRGIEQMMAIVSMNHLQPPFNNVLIRRALQAAVGQEDVVAGIGLPPSMYLPHCYSIYMCNAPGTSDAGTETYRSAGIERARALLKEAGYKNEPVVFLHASTSAILNPVGLVVADQMKRAGFNVDVRTSDFATVAEKRRNRGPVEAGGWSVIPIVWNGVDMVNPLSDPAVSYNCSDSNPSWYCDAKLTDLLHRYSETTEPAARKDLADQIQAEFHRNVDYVLAGPVLRPDGIPSGPSRRGAVRLPGVLGDAAEVVRPVRARAPAAASGSGNPAAVFAPSASHLCPAATARVPAPTRRPAASDDRSVSSATNPSRRTGSARRRSRRNSR